MPFLRQDEAPTQAEREKMPEHLFGLPDEKKYPLDTPEHVRAAASYAAKEHNAGRLSDEKFSTLQANLKKAREKFGIGEENKKDDSRWERVERFDLAVGEVTDRRRTQQGGLIARANMTRTGVFQYRQADGSVRREYRPPDEVFDAESLRSLSHATYTDDHPDRVSPDNWGKVARGHVAGTPHRSGKFVQGDIHIQHRDAIDKAEKGQHQELSCGYECGIDPTPGVSPEGEEYDVIQRNIRYNHVAAGPAGWGRAGKDVRLHLDGGASVSLDGAALPAKQYESDRYVRGMGDQASSEDKARADKAEAETAQLRLDMEKMQGELVGLRRLQDEATAAKKQGEEAQRLDASFDEQFETFDLAREHIGRSWTRKDASGRNKSVAEVRREVIEKLRPDWKADMKDLSDAGIEGMFRAAVKSSARATRGAHDLFIASGGGMVFDGKEPPAFLKKKGAGGDDDDEETEDSMMTKRAQDAMFQRQKDAYKMPSKRDRRRGYDSGQTVPVRSAFGGGNQGNASGGFGGGC